MAIADIVSAIVKAGVAVKNQLDLVKDNNKNAEQLVGQIGAITDAVSGLADKSLDSTDELNYSKALTALSKTLSECAVFLKDFISAKDRKTVASKLGKFFKATKHNEALAGYRGDLLAGQAMLTLALTAKNEKDRAREHAEVMAKFAADEKVREKEKAEKAFRRAHREARESAESARINAGFQKLNEAAATIAAAATSVTASRERDEYKEQAGKKYDSASWGVVSEGAMRGMMYMPAASAMPVVASRGAGQTPIHRDEEKQERRPTVISGDTRMMMQALSISGPAPAVAKGVVVPVQSSSAVAVAGSKSFVIGADGKPRDPRSIAFFPGRLGQRKKPAVAAASAVETAKDKENLQRFVPGGRVVA